MRYSFLFLIICSTCLGAAKPHDTELKVQKLFEQFGRYEFISYPESEWPVILMGPTVTLKNRDSIHCCILKYQGEIVAQHGKMAFDVAFKHLDDERVFIRIIAVEALYSITGEKPLWFYYGKPGQTFNGDEDWSDRAKAIWKKWKAQQDGAGQPATAPQSKSQGNKNTKQESKARSQ